MNIKECPKCHGIGWVRTTKLVELNRPDRCWDCGGTGVAYHKFQPDDSPGRCNYCPYLEAQWVHRNKADRLAEEKALQDQRQQTTDDYIKVNHLNKK